MPTMGTKVGEIPILRGSPPVVRTLEVYIDEDFLPRPAGALASELEKCVTFREVSTMDGRFAVILSRSISSDEARAFSDLLRAAADVLDTVAANDEAERSE